ncbi:hypothetical protein DYBT9275_02394 [Dyadobacter sp. CECT 9275]|uniref:FecR family protein n=1 Tax=Dyadobacter helix TaxID=2822344 RepID=A0A916JBR3_9BACT|nr:FecR family protein [Dyadobacter sp. CECT 9275]CAG5000120.1 hypothetical protein DYBT9275_02394 [Dyadobacter sp. CECT 9275]
MHYENYQPEDFLKDDDFIQWVKNPTDAQILFWEKWLSEHPEKALTVARAREIILSVRYKNYYQPAESEMMAVWENIRSGERSASSRAPWYRQLPLPAVTRYAAAAVIVLLLTLLSRNYLNQKDSQSESVAVSSPVRVEHRTARGEKTTLTLPDGSKIKLNAGSRIVYQSDFGRKNRDLTLEGEAFFDVTHDTSRPFRIRTGGLTTTVVGTSFNISAYEENPIIKVAVLTGKVRVMGESKSGGENEMLVVPDEMSVFAKETGGLTMEGFDRQLELGWKDNVIILKNAGFPEIKKVLEREYAVTFVVEKGLKVKEEFSAKFENAPIKKILDALNYTSRFQYNLVKDKVYVTQKHEK